MWTTNTDRSTHYALRFMTAHIWACPPSEGDDYSFHCHPDEQKIPKPKRLTDWYRKMLDRGKSDSVVYEYRVSGCGGKRGIEFWFRVGVAKGDVGI